MPRLKKNAVDKMGCTCHLLRKKARLSGDGGKEIPWGTVAVLGLGVAGLYLLSDIFGGSGDEDKPPPPEKPLPNSGSGIPDGWAADPMARNLYELMKGINILPTTITKLNEAIKELVDLPTNDMFVAVYNRFNTAYGHGQTLRQWIKGEYTIVPSLKEAAIKRFDSLQLSGQPTCRQHFTLHQCCNNIDKDLDLIATNRFNFI